jgi:hypothetical protein
MAMTFRKPITSLGGLIWWKIIQQDSYFIMQQHSMGLPVWPYRYRIITRENRMEIANSNDIADIEEDWQYLQTHAVPQIEQKIDVWDKVSSIPIFEIVKLIVATRMGQP